MEVLFVAGDGAIYDARRMDPMESVGGKELDYQLAHARMEFEDGTGSGALHVEGAITELLFRAVLFRAVRPEIALINLSRDSPGLSESTTKSPTYQARDPDGGAVSE
jgi:hypothetical protein